MSTNPGSITDCTSTHSLGNELPHRTSTADGLDLTASSDAVMIPLPLELCYEVYELLSPVDILSLGLASKHHLELLEGWMFRSSYRGRKHLMQCRDYSGGFSPGKAFRICFRAGRVHMGNLLVYGDKNMSRKKLLQKWLGSDNDWKVCDICLAFLKPVQEGDRKYWRGLADGRPTE